MLDKLIEKMIEYYGGDPKRIQHFIKVHSFSKLIGELEKISKDKLFVLEVASIVHDIGIKVSEEKYGSCGGKLQEKEGPPIAEKMLLELNISQDVINRVCFLVAHHHTYDKIDDVDYQILIEADFLVNCYEDNLPKENVKKVMDKIFKTNTGIKLCSQMFKV